MRAVPFDWELLKLFSFARRQPETASAGIQSAVIKIILTELGDSDIGESTSRLLRCVHG